MPMTESTSENDRTELKNTSTKTYRLERYKDSLRIAWGYNDYNDWPIKLNSILHLFITEFTREFLDDLKTTDIKQIPDADIASAFGNPARVYRLINPVIFGMKRLRLPVEEQRSVVIRMLDIVKMMKYGSEFNEDNCNLILSPGRVAELCQQNNLRKAGPEEAGLLQRFCGIMWAYTESIFFRAHDVTKEVHGPYLPDDNGDQLLVREYLNLSPTGIWGHMPFIPYTSIAIYTGYNTELNVSIDPYNHIFLHRGNYVQNLTGYWILIDGQDAELDELTKILPIMQKTIRSIHQWVSKAGTDDLINRYADIFWYRKRPLRELIGRNWQVPQQVRENICNGKADSRRLENLSEEAIERLIRFII